MKLAHREVFDIIFEVGHARIIIKQARYKDTGEFLTHLEIESLIEKYRANIEIFYWMLPHLGGVFSSRRTKVMTQYAE